MKKIILLFLIFMSCKSERDFNFEIEQLSEKHQKCLDSGKNMMNCSRQFHFEMNHMLKIVLKECRISLNKTEQESLEREQLLWSKKREQYITEQNQEFNDKIKSEEWGQDMYMAVYQNDADFVKARVLELIKRMKK
ncbi:hypothetical protein [Flavobacterium psychrotolerans]|uniref:Lysozyme inhibitor LprI N-terminal domain-containing protein n=1 Tax=Flavobacterium psychrotolerans TaxID=2169410 RepID=A0A2U1JNM8_9FLAO|nr:hypothetical protein [Flavobacterium psychrotolerans]PWA06574.1 hypothetical protein DB895_03935 [Flavobacterium psychrotolerans]